MGQRQGTKANVRMTKAKNRRKRKQNKAGKFCISGIAIVLLVVMSIQIADLQKKNEQYIKKENQLTSELKKEEERQQEIEEYEAYMQSDEYIEKVAKSKWGLVHPNDILFKENE